MNRSTFIIFLLLSLYVITLNGQHAYFPNKGKIKFEKEVYVKARFREMEQKMSQKSPRMHNNFDVSFDNIPEKTTSFYEMTFDEDETLMLSDVTDIKDENNARRSSGRQTPVRRGNRTTSRPRRSSSNGLNTEKIYYQNIDKNESEVTIYLDDKYILKDSLQSITWRFTDEYREIAGYNCRRVNGATADSLYLVAFYTDQIPLAGGPALIGGLPGMILGLAIPEMHINYWARNVEFTVDNVTSNWRDKKSKQLTAAELFDLLKSSVFFRRQGTYTEAQYRRDIMENLIY